MSPPDVSPAPLSIHRPEAEPRGGIVVVQEAFGVNGHIEDIGRRLAAAGWLAVIPHLFHRTGDAVVDYGDFAKVRPHMRALTAEGILADVDVALAALADAAVDSAGIGIVGFCMGGTVALVVAARRDLGASVTFYGSGITEGRFGFEPLAEEVRHLRAPWLGLFGDLDSGIPVEQVEILRSAAAESGQETEVVRYPDAGHGFNCDRRDAFHGASATDAWTRTLGWFATHLS